MSDEYVNGGFMPGGRTELPAELPVELGGCLIVDVDGTRRRREELHTELLGKLNREGRIPKLTVNRWDPPEETPEPPGPQLCECGRHLPCRHCDPAEERP